MAGRPRARLRKEALDAAVKAARLAEAGDPGAADALKTAQALADLADKAIGCSDAAGSDAKAAELAEVITAPPPPRPPEPDLFALVASKPAPLTPDEFSAAAGVLACCVSEGGGANPDDGQDMFLANALPALGPEGRIRAARYLAALAKEPLRPGGGRRSAPDMALAAAGLPYTALEAMGKAESVFADACETLGKARRRAVMNMLEETLLERAFDGQTEVNAKVGVTKVFDNRLAFDLLRYNHENYEHSLGKTASNHAKGGGGGMTLMIAQGGQLPAKRAHRALGGD